MLRKFLILIKFFLYSEPSFFIKKESSIEYFVRAKNGLNAEIIVMDRIMFVKAWSTVDHVAFYYCTPMNPDDNSIERFVIDNIKNSVVFHLTKDQLKPYVSTYSEFFERFSTPEYPTIFMGYSGFRRFSEKSEEEKYPYQFIKYNDRRYPVLYFNRKKIIKNVFRYNMNAVLNTDKSRVQKVTYIADGAFFYLSNLHDFYNQKTHSSSPRVFSGLMFSPNIWNYFKSEITVGVKNQLFDHHSVGVKYLNLKKIWVLRTDDREFCLLLRNKREFTLSYITHTRYGSKKCEEFIQLHYSKGKFRKKNNLVTDEAIQQHEMAISSQLMDRIEVLKLKKPSVEIIQRLSNLEMPTKLPLNPDDLIVLDMFEV